MRVRGVATGFLMALVMAAPVRAQFAATQDSTLRGLERVYINFQSGGGALTPAQLTQSTSFVSLELRKAGLRIVSNVSELDLSKDGLLNIAFVKVERALSTDLALSIDVEQHASLTRTGSVLQMVTWYYADDRRNVVVDQVLQPMLRQGLDKFLNAWLTANGR